jgi:hypothetical protein
MRNRISALFLALALVLAAVSTSSATLTVIGQGTITAAGDRLYGLERSNGGVGQTVDLVYSSLLDVTILNFVNVRAGWEMQMHWAENLVVEFNGTSFENWRLPATDESVITPEGFNNYYHMYSGPNESGQYDYWRGYNMTNSELGILYHEELGNLSSIAKDGSSLQSGYGLINKGPLTALSEGEFWSETDFSRDPDKAWHFNFMVGALNSFYSYEKNVARNALAVLPGNPIPIPGAALVFIIGLGSLALLRRK